MRRIIINFLLLASIASAVPDGRYKRTGFAYEYIKNFITSTLFGGSDNETPPELSIEIVPEYKLYGVPGFDDIIIKVAPGVPEEVTVLSKPNQMLEIQPFESFIETESTQDTARAFENVNNLLSTEIWNKEQSRLLKKTMIPMISGLNLGGESFRPARILSERIQSEVDMPDVSKKYPGDVNRDAVKENLKLLPVVAETTPSVLSEADTTVKVEVPLVSKEPYEQLEKDEPVIKFTHQNPKDIARQQIERTSALPMCIKQRIDEVVSLATNPHRKIHIKGGLPLKSEEVQNGLHAYDSQRFQSTALDDPLIIDLLPPSTPDSKEVGHKEPLDPEMTPLTGFDPNHLPVSNPDSLKSIDNEYDRVTPGKIELLKTIDPIPPQGNPLNKTELPKQLEEKYGKSNDDDDMSVVRSNVHKEKFSQDLTVAKSTDNVLKTTNNFPSKLNIDKTKDEVDTDTPLEKSYAQINNISRIPSPRDMSSSDIKGNKNDIAKSKGAKITKEMNIAKVPDSHTKAKSHSQYTYKQVHHNNADAFKIIGQKDELQSRDNDSPLPRNYIYVPPDVDNKSLIGVLNSVRLNNNVKMSGKKIIANTENETLAQYIYNRVTHDNPQAIRALEERNEPNTNVKTNSPTINSAKIAKTDDRLPKETLSQYIYKQVDDNQSVHNMVKHEDKSKSTKPHVTNTLSSNIVVQNIPDDFSPDTIIGNSGSASEVVTVVALLNSPKEKNRHSLKDNPIVVAKNYRYHQRRLDGSSASIKGNKDGVYVDINDKSSKGRGDIPGQDVN